MYDQHTRNYHEDVTIRVAAPEEWDAIDRLAQRDSAPPPPRDAMLVAEVDDEMLAAVSVRNGYAIADPFRHTGGHVALLRARAEQLRGGYRSSRGARARVFSLGRLRGPARSQAR